MTRPSPQHRLEFSLMRAAELSLARMSARGAERVGEVLGELVHSPLRIRRKVVEANLRVAYPEAEPAWIDGVVREAYRHLGREAVAMLRLSRLDSAAVRETVAMTDATAAAVEHAFAEGRGALLATGHYGNWEMAAAAVAARGIPIVAVVKRQSNRLVDHRIEEARRALGVETVSMRDAPRRVPRELRAGKGIGMVADQDARGRGVFVPFFGVLASAHRGPAHFALRIGSPLIAAVARRLPDDRYLVEGERIDTTPTGDFEADVRRITAALAGHLERQIRRDPAQYFWFHKRWKTRPPEEPPTRHPGNRTRVGRGGSPP